MTSDQEAAEKYMSDWNHHRFAYSKDYTPQSAFLAGVSHGRKEERAEILRMLTSNGDLAAYDFLVMKLGEKKKP